MASNTIGFFVMAFKGIQLEVFSAGEVDEPPPRGFFGWNMFPGALLLAYLDLPSKCVKMCAEIHPQKTTNFGRNFTHLGRSRQYRRQLFFKSEHHKTSGVVCSKHRNKLHFEWEIPTELIFLKCILQSSIASNFKYWIKHNTRQHNATQRNTTQHNTDRQTDRQTDKQTNNQANKQTNKQTKPNQNKHLATKKKNNRNTKKYQPYNHTTPYKKYQPLNNYYISTPTSPPRLRVWRFQCLACLGSDADAD